MSTALSTYPTFASPSDTGRDWTWLIDRLNMTKPVTLKSGAIASVPLVFWETQAVCVHGLADAESVDLLLRDQGLRARHVDPADPSREKPGSGRARVRIWAPNYGGSSVGPLRTVHALIHVQPRRECKQNEKDGPPPDHWWWWWYYGDSILNQEFKRDVWGVPNELAAVELSYLSGTKSVRVLENGGTALRITCALPSVSTAAAPPAAAQAGTPGPSHPSGPWPQAGSTAARPSALPGIVAMPDFHFRTVARRSHDDGENWASVKLGGAVRTGDIPRDDDTIFYVRRDSAIDRHLRGVGFRASKWSFFEEYHGIIELWDERGSGKDPVRDTDDRYEVVRQGDTWLVREFEAQKAKK